jgi:hypothetical protein
MRQITKILGLGIVFLFLNSMQLSAQKCKFDYEKNDPFTGEVTKGISLEIREKASMPSVTHSGKPFRYNFIVNRLGDKYFIDVDIYFGGNVRELIRKGEPFIFKLSNGETISLTAQEDVVPIAIGQPSGGIWTQYKAKYSIDAETLQRLSTFSPTHFRFSLEGKNYDRELASKEQKKFTQAAACIL